MVQLFRPTGYSDIKYHYFIITLIMLVMKRIFGNVFCFFIGNINQQAQNDRNSVYIVLEIIKNVLRQF